MIATPAWPPRSAPRLFVAGPLAAGQALVLAGGQAHYLARVMRVGEGDAVVLCDDMTGEWAARVAHAGKRDVTLTVADKLRERETVPDFTLCAALIKKPRFDLILEKAIELGVRRIQPVITRRGVADKLNLERARAIVTEAAEQCARTALPELAEPVKLDALLSGWDANRALFFADELGGEPAARAFAGYREPLRRQGPPPVGRETEGGLGQRRDSRHAALLIGPEGGFDDEERAAIRAMPQAIGITLGPRILRADTAAAAAVSLWMAAAGDW